MPVDEPLRIAIIGSSSHPIVEPFAGGMESHIWQLARTLTLRSHSVTLFAAPGSAVEPGQSVLEVEPLELCDTQSSTPAAIVQEHHAYLSVLVDLAGPRGRDFDIVHNHSLHYLPIAMAATLPMPMLTTLHTPPFDWLESAVAVGRPDPASFVTVSANCVDRWSPVIDRIGLVPNGIDLERWPAGLGGDYAVWSGRMVPEKAPHLAIAAAAEVGMPLRLAGPVADPDYFAEHVAPALGAGASYEGHLRHRDLARLVGGACAALVTPDWDEPYGLVVAEALACGTPVAAFERGGIPEIVDASCGRLAPPNDVAALAEALIEASMLSRASARKRAEQYCSVDNMVDTYVALYRDAVGRRRR